MGRPGLVIFDCDGVLVDSEPIDSAACASLLRKHGVPVSEEEATELFRGMSNEGVVDVVALRYGVRLWDGFVQELEATLHEALRTSPLQAMPGARQAVERVLEAGCAVCVASNGEVAKMELTLTRTGLLDYFDANLFSKDHVARGKPAPDLFLYAAARMGVEPPACVVVEDSVAGVRAGMEAGMRVLGYAPRGDYLGLGDCGAEPFVSLADVPSLAGL